MKEIETLLKVYRKAYVRILVNIATSYKKGNYGSVNYQKDLLNQVEKEIRLLDKNAAYFSETVIKKVYEETQIKELLLLNKEINNKNFSLLNKDVIKLLSDDLEKSLKLVNNSIEGSIKDLINSITTEASLQSITTDTQKAKLYEETIQTMIDSGIKGFVDEAGRAWELQNYVSMAIQTKVTETVNTAVINTADAVGSDLVRMSSHSTSCPVCALYEGRIYSISGKDKRYPKLDIVFKEYNVIHPRCRHRLTVYIEEGFTEAEKKVLQEKSNRDFIDDRSDRRKELYNKRLETKAIERRLEKLDTKIQLLALDENAKLQYKREKAKFILLQDKYKKQLKEIQEWKVD